jgi:uracil-DNA glycosylase
MSGIKRDLLAYAEFLRQSGYLYVEGGESAAPGASARRDQAAGAFPGPEPRADSRATSPDPPADSVVDSSVAAGPAERGAWEKAARARVAECRACPLCGTRTQTVYGTGSLGAKIVFVGEAPGAEEDRTGAPFVGRAGQLLTKMIESIGFSRDEVYICNTIKCRPPDNRDPTPEEKQACRPFLEEQLQILRPQILVGLGAHAAGYLTGMTSSLGSMRRRWHEFSGVPTMVTYHPAFLLRSPGMKKQAWEDLQMLARRYNELNPDDARDVWKKS